ncbi:phosphoribosyltransferase [Streptomyces sp. NPDC057908]|uniref:phosphoribosyltransferase n=1 Tax=Streptomyces sp. NPDC057908 TaxID=3346276 RepID=UPI0036E048DD
MSVSSKSFLVVLNPGGSPVRRNAPLDRPRTELRPGGCLPIDAPGAGWIFAQPPHRQAVVGIMRGGVIPAVWLAHGLGIRDVRAVEITRTTSDSIDTTKTTLPRVRNAASLSDLAGLDVPLVDDITGSGAILVHTADVIRARGPARVRTAVLTVNRANWAHEAEPHRVIDYIASMKGP